MKKTCLAKGNWARSDPLSAKIVFGPAASLGEQYQAAAGVHHRVVPFCRLPMASMMSVVEMFSVRGR